MKLGFLLLILTSQAFAYEAIVRSNSSQLVASYAKCNSATPEISLEAKVPYPNAKFQGAFYNIPKDNQDGLGTCYANVAKNLLIGISKSKDQASYLDIALAYKQSMDHTRSGLDGGLSCDALRAIQQKGYCPKTFSPLEMGEKNLYSQGLFGGVDTSLYMQGKTIKYLQDFFESQENFKAKNPKLADSMMKQAKVIVENLSNFSHLKLPLPIARVQIPSDEKLLDAFRTRRSTNPSFSADIFLGDYKIAYKKFFPEYMKAVVAGHDRNKIFANFKVVMKPFLTRYSVTAGELETWKRFFLQNTKNDADDKNLKESIKESKKFLMLMSGMDTTGSDEDFYLYCKNNSDTSIDFLMNLQPLVKHLQLMHVDTSALINKNDKFKSLSDLMQIAIAPECLNPAKRQKISSDFLCDNGDTTVSVIKSRPIPVSEQIELLRGRVVDSLLEGYPLGNTFSTSETQAHINTIVGMRFNKIASRCEYQIRESQTGQTSWQAEREIFHKITSLSEVRRK